MHMGDGRPPMGLAYISAYLESFGHQTKIIDLYHFGGGHKDEKGDKQASTIISHIVQNKEKIDRSRRAALLLATSPRHTLQTASA